MVKVMYVFQFPATGSVEGVAVAGVGPGVPTAAIPSATGRRGADRPAAAEPHSRLSCSAAKSRGGV